MAAIGSLYPTLVDIVKRTDPNGAIAQTAELLSKVNPILDDIPYVEGNLPTGHRYTGRTALPSLGWRRFNQGIASSKSTTEQYDETCGILEGNSFVDCAIANLNGNAAQFRMDEDTAFINAMGIEIATGLFYHNTSTAPEKFLGITPRLNSTANTPAAGQIIKGDASAAGANQTSIILVGWSPQTVFGIFPKGSQAGMKMYDGGKQLITDVNGNRYWAWATNFTWQMGMVVKDYRYVVRVANIDTTRWKADLSQGADLVDAMLQARAALWETNTVQPVFYMNRQTFSMLNRQLMKKATVNLLEYVERGGNRIPAFLDIPIRIVDALVNSESLVT